MRVVLAEKPSVAKELASFLRAGERHEGYFEGAGYQVTWAFGHLVQLQEPEDYDPALARWSLEALPFIPAEFRLKLTGDAGARRQFGVIQRLVRAAAEVVVATDAGREGELIARYILAVSGCERKPARRLWLRSLTPAAIRDAFQQLRPASDYDSLYAAARCRNQADWIVGLNATRNYTVRHGGRGLLWSVGRVQTPVLALIVERDEEILAFRPEPFWELVTRYRGAEFKYRGGRFQEEPPALELLHKTAGHPLEITAVQKKPAKVLPPQLYDLTELQREMNRRFGMSADSTLKAAQSLYEKKLITYPRTDSRYLGSDMKGRVPEILDQLRRGWPREIEGLNLAGLPFTARIIDDRKVTDHHAILPTGSAPSSLSGGEQRVYDAVALRLIAAFYPPCLKEITTVEGQSHAVPFQARGERITQPGWTAIVPRAGKSSRKGGEHDEEGEESSDQELPAFRVSERGPHAPEVRRGETSPPRHFTENTLLAAMETAGKLVDDEQLKEALRERGLGTPATRAAIIETLLKRNYIERAGKQLLATDLGRYLIALLRSRDLKSAELTGQWEAKLREIEAGRLAPERFMAEIADFTRRMIRADEDRRIDSNRWGPCPLCGREVMRGKRGFGCSGWREGCRFVLWPDEGGRSLSEDQVRELLQLGLLRAPLQTADGPPSLLALTGAGRVVELPLPARDAPRAKQGRDRARRGARTAPRDGSARAAGPRQRRAGRDAASAQHPSPGGIGACPLCGAAVTERKVSFSCSRWDQGCRFVIWKTIAGKTISARTAKTLLSKGRTAMLKGFQSKAGKKFAARLTLVEGEVKLEFADA